MSDRARTRSVIDTVATLVLGVLAVLAAAGSVVFSSFFVMATDPCGPGQCDMSKLALAYAITWGGAAAAVIGAAVGVVVATRRAKPRWIWPALALVVVIAALAIGSGVASTVNPHPA